MGEYHIQHFDPIQPHWPKGGWSVYQITADQIADRIIRSELVPGTESNFGPHYRGDVIARYSWCGYLGIVEDLTDVPALIAKKSK